MSGITFREMAAKLEEPLFVEAIVFSDHAAPLPDWGDTAMAALAEADEEAARERQDDTQP